MSQYKLLMNHKKNINSHNKINHFKSFKYIVLLDLSRLFNYSQLKLNKNRKCLIVD